MKKLPIGLLLIVLLLNSCSDHPTTIRFPEGMEELKIGENSKALCSDCPKKFVGYLDLTQRGLHFMELTAKMWQELYLNHPEFSVIWVFGGESVKIDKNELKRLLEEMGYPYSVMYDKENKFYELNQLEKIPHEVKAIQSYFVNGDDIIIDAEPGMPNLFRKQLSEFLILK
jgi:hypothetical protein